MKAHHGIFQTAIFPFTLLPRSGLSLRIQLKSLHPPTGNLRHRNFVVVAAIDLMDGTKLAGHLATLAEFAYHSSVEFHLVDLAAHRVESRTAIVRIRVGAIQVLVRPRRD